VWRQSAAAPGFLSTELTRRYEMSDRAKVAEFVSFCIEVFASAKKKPGADVIRLFDSCGLVDYLDECYDVLHTQGREWLIADMEDYLKVRGIAA
jgi:hypothetical protein